MQKYELISIEDLRPLELVFPNHLENLRRIIKSDGIIRQALIVDRENKIVLDGSHRHVFLLMEGYQLAPVHFVDYSDPHIRVGTSRIHRMLIKGNVGISKEEVIERGLNSNLFSPRTTRHFFPFLREEIDIPLASLVQKSSRDVTMNISNDDLTTEINHNEKYIREIEEESEELIKYIMEGINTKKYLQQQLDIMKDK